jgi:F420-non-reducing hydrogenase small subunit
MGDKPKVAVCWFGGCGGCDEAIVDLNEDILRIADAVDFVLWPVALDFKYDHLRALKDGEITLSIINGSVRNSEHKELAHLLRGKSTLVMAFGAYECFGGTPGLANLRGREDIMQWVYKEAPTVINPQGNVPQVNSKVNGHNLTLPELYNQVFPLHAVIKVDYYLPGCPPPPDLIAEAINSIVLGPLPPKGTTLAPHRALCETCARNETKPVRLSITEFKRISEVEADPEKCFLDQGILCMGPATRSGCGEACMGINIPCRGCFGPVEGVADMGSKYVSALIALIDAETTGAAEKVIDQILDPAGYFYRFTTASSILQMKRNIPKT